MKILSGVCSPGKIGGDMTTVVIHNQGWNKHSDGWYQANILSDNVDKVDQMLEWIELNIQGYHKHTTWKWIENQELQVRFRHERDCEWFILRWS